MTLHPHPHLQHQKRRSYTCHRHPTTEPITGFCASCLRERLDGIHNKSPTNAAATPKLRRSKSCAGGPNPSSASASEPSRKSCEDRTHNTLHDLFSVDDRLGNPNPNHLPSTSNVQSIQVFQDLEETGELKTMKEFIDLEWGNNRASRKSFWESASVLSKKLRKWRRKQSKKEENESLNRPNPMRFRETQSEVGEYGPRRGSCDTDPRLSIDVGRLSVDDYRISFEEPRASWDGYLIGKQNPRATQMSLVGEDVNAEERLSVVKEEDSCPGGSVQTRDYYGDSANLQTWRRSFDRSGSNRRMSCVEFDEVRVSNVRASPEAVGLFHGAKLLVTEKELRDSNWYSLKDFRSKSAESASRDVGVLATGVSQKGSISQKKSWKWKNVLSVWGSKHRQKESELEGEDKSSRSDVGNGIIAQPLHKLRMMANEDVDKESKCNVGDERLTESLQKLRMVASGDREKVVGATVCEGTLAESLQKLRRVANADANHGVVCEKLMRSYSVSARNSCKMNGSINGLNITEANSDGENKTENALLRNRSSRYSPKNPNTGFLSFHLSPLKTYGRSRSGKVG